MKCEREAFLGQSKRREVFRLEVTKMHCVHLRNCQRINENIKDKSIKKNWNQQLLAMGKCHWSPL